MRKYKPDRLLIYYSADTALRTLYNEMWSTRKPYFRLLDGRLKIGNFPVPQDRFESVERWFLERSRLFAFIKDKWIRISENIKYERFLNYQDLMTDQNLFQLDVEILKLLKKKLAHCITLRL